MTINEQLHQLNIWKDACCIFCGRKYPETILNIEGHIHHGCRLICLDSKSCTKQRKKKNDKHNNKK